MAKESFLSSTIGRKIVVSLTGFFLISFLVVHVSINSTLLLGDRGETFNIASHFMAYNWIIRILEVGLFLGFILHIIMTLRLYFENRRKRPVKYTMTNQQANSKWYSRSMTLLGTLLLIFLVIHISDFWADKLVHIYYRGEEVKDYYTNVKTSLSQWYNLLIYIGAFVALGYHLLHGFPSAFQTLGLNHKKYTPIIKFLGTAFSIIVPALFSAIALALFFDLV